MTVRIWALSGMLGVACAEPRGMGENTVTTPTTGADDDMDGAQTDGAQTGAAQSSGGSSGDETQGEGELLPCEVNSATLTFEEGPIETCLADVCLAPMSIETQGNVAVFDALRADLDGDGQAELVTRGEIRGDACEHTSTLMTWVVDDNDEWTLLDTEYVVGTWPLYTVDANEDGLLDVGAGLDIVLGAGDGTFAEHPENGHEEESVYFFADLGARGIHLFGYLGNHDHGAVPYGTFYTHHDFSNGALRGRSALHTVPGLVAPLGPDSHPFTHRVTDHCQWIRMREWQDLYYEPIFTLEGTTCTAASRIDLDDDGIFDIVASTDDGTVLAIRVDSEGELSQGPELFQGFAVPFASIAGDANGDGHDDLWVFGRENNFAPSRVALALRNDDSFVISPQSLPFEKPNHIVSRDFDGDGRDDLVWSENGVSRALVSR